MRRLLRAIKPLSSGNAPTADFHSLQNDGEHPEGDASSSSSRSITKQASSLNGPAILSSGGENIPEKFFPEDFDKKEQLRIWPGPKLQGMMETIAHHRGDRVTLLLTHHEPGCWILDPTEVTTAPPHQPRRR
jgi:hypothetical protein